MTFKTKERYAFGWADPRAFTMAVRFEEIATMVFPHYASDMTDDQLRAAWLLVYGEAPVTFVSIRDKWYDDVDTMRVAQETHARGLLISQADFASFSDIYVLKDKLNASS
jgi:hypothetical protein